MRFLTCGADGILVELADLDETLRVFAALQSAVSISWSMIRYGVKI